MSSPVATRANHSATQGRGKGAAMSDTSGRSLPLPLMRYDLASSSWRTCEDTSLWDLAMSSPSFPEWGTTQDGELFELRTPVRPTVERGSSSLPTPHAGLGERGRDGVYPNERGQQDLQHAISALLPTPVADHSRGLAQPGTAFHSLRNVAISALLPTPRAAEAQHSGRSVPAKPGQQQGLTETVNLLPTPTAVQGRNATSGRQPEAVFNTGTTLQDLVFDGSLSTGVSTPSPSTVGNKSSVEQHQIPPSPEPTGDHDSTLFSWSG